MRKLFLYAVLLTLVILPARFGYADIDGDMVLYLPFDEGNGNEAKDQSKNGNNAQLDGVDWVDGKYGKAIALEGDGASCGLIPHNDSLIIEGEISILMWLKIDEYKAGEIAQPLDKATHNGGEHKTYSMMLNQGIIHGRFGSDQNRQSYNSPTPIELDKWEHCAVTLDADGYVVYLNGEEIAAEGVAYKFEGTNTNDLNIGCPKDRPQYGYKGLVDELIIYSRALTATEVKQVMEGGLVAVFPAGKLATTWGGLKQD